jgi:hypothetical protein
MFAKSSSVVTALCTHQEPAPQVQPYESAHVAAANTMVFAFRNLSAMMQDLLAYRAETLTRLCCAAACFDLGYSWQQLSCKLGVMPRRERSLAVSLMQRVLHKMEVRIHASRGPPPNVWDHGSSHRSRSAPRSAHKHWQLPNGYIQVPLTGAAITAATVGMGGHGNQFLAQPNVEHIPAAPAPVVTSQRPQLDKAGSSAVAAAAVADAAGCAHLSHSPQLRLLVHLLQQLMGQVACAHPSHSPQQ